MEPNPEPISYLTQQEAMEIGELLTGPLGFSVAQLMELAGLSVATAIAEVYGPAEHNRVLAICGPGNNGGDGLVAARHLCHFGYKPYLCYPKRTPKPLYTGLLSQLESLSIPLLSVEDLPVEFLKDFDIIVDAIFGFSFHGTARPPFDELIQRLVSIKSYGHIHQTSPAVVSVDIPSGWHVEEGDVDSSGIEPDMLVSLTAPKLCAKKFCGRHHFLGSRFVPPSIVEKFKLQLPPYPGTSMCVRMGKPSAADISVPREDNANSDFLKGLLEGLEADPFDQFQKWFNIAVARGIKEPNFMALSTASRDGKISSRMVELCRVDKDGFVWCTSYESRKAQELSENSHASILFYWDLLKCQVGVEGPVEKVCEEESDHYFHNYHREIQIRPIVCKQSIVIPEWQVLRQQYNELKEMYCDRSSIRRPKHWGGYRLKPEFFEFWHGEESRVHLKLRYSAKHNDGTKEWKVDTLSK